VPLWQCSRTTGGGVLSELAIHHVDLWRFLTGSEVREVFAYTRSVGRDDETAVLSARLDDGTVAIASFSQGTSRSNDMVVCGAAGSIALSLYRFDGYARTMAGRLEGASGSRLAGLRSAIAGLPRALRDHRAGGTWRSTYQDAWRHFGAAIRDGVPVESTLEDGRRAFSVVLAAMESATSGRSVEVSR
jgi:predicted dehydrogenase